MALPVLLSLTSKCWTAEGLAEIITDGRLLLGVVETAALSNENFASETPVTSKSADRCSDLVHLITTKANSN